MNKKILNFKIYPINTVLYLIISGWNIDIV